jgi:hypothetical protein
MATTPHCVSRDLLPALLALIVAQVDALCSQETSPLDAVLGGSRAGGRGGGLTSLSCLAAASAPSLRSVVTHACDIAAGAPDCNDDGIPNGAPVVGIAAEQLAEESEILGWLVGSSPRAWLAGAYFPIDRTMRIDAARFRINPGTDPTHPASPLGKPFTIVIAQDADGSADLRRAQVEWTGTGSYRHQSLQSLSTPSVVVEPPGFFVCYSIPPGTFNSSSGGTAAPTLRVASWKPREVSRIEARPCRWRRSAKRASAPRSMASSPGSPPR